jgi:hypothetical protein
MPAKHMDHTAYPKGLKSKDEAALRYIMKDCREAIAAMPDGENAGYYMDEIHYCAMELRRREKKQ